MPFESKSNIILLVHTGNANELDELVQTIIDSLNGSARETAQCLQNDLRNLESDQKSGNIDGICNIFRGEGIQHMVEIYKELQPGNLRKAIGDIIVYQKKTVIDKNCDAASVQSLMAFITTSLRNAVILRK